MQNPFRLLSQYFWLIALAFSAFNYWKAKHAIAALPEVANQQIEAETLLKRFAIGAALPWLVMGVGQVAGVTPSVWYYFRPQDGNPFVIAWLAVIFATACVYAWWVLLANGAQKVREYRLLRVVGGHHPGMQSELAIKLFAAIGPLFVLFWVYLAVSMNSPLPP